MCPISYHFGLTIRYRMEIKIMTITVNKQTPSWKQEDHDVIAYLLWSPA